MMVAFTEITQHVLINMGLKRVLRNKITEEKDTHRINLGIVSIAREFRFFFFFSRNLF